RLREGFVALVTLPCCRSSLWRAWRRLARLDTYTFQLRRLAALRSGERGTLSSQRTTAFDRLRPEEFDVVVVGGGATGTGIALEAATRGLKTVLLERHDFSSGTSSRSTKLVHGGVRYLEQAVKHADRSQFHLVREALKERAVLLHNAPHL